MFSDFSVTRDIECSGSVTLFVSFGFFGLFLAKKRSAQRAFV